VRQLHLPGPKKDPSNGKKTARLALAIKKANKIRTFETARLMQVVSCSFAVVDLHFFLLEGGLYESTFSNRWIDL
jgi:hypothetical protein